MVRRSKDDSQARFHGPLPTKRSRTSSTVGRLVMISDQRSQGKQMPSYLIHESSHGNQVDNQT